MEIRDLLLICIEKMLRFTSTENEPPIYTIRSTY